MITVEHRRDDALAAGFEAMQGRLPEGFSFGAFESAWRDWDVKAFCDGERTIGILITKGPELHVAIIPEYRRRWLSRRLIREVFAPILAAHGKAELKVAPGNEIGRDFVERIREGFATKRFDMMTAIGVGGSILGGLIQADAASSAADTQAAAADRATALQKYMFDIQNKQLEPYRQAGYNALGLFGRGLDPNAPTAAAGAKPSFMWEGKDYGSAENFKNVNLANYRSITGLEPSEDVNAQLDAYIAQARAKGGEVVAGVRGAEPGIQPGQFLHQFNADDLKSSLAPNYEFIKQQGLGAATNALNVLGGYGGNLAKGVMDYGTNLAGNAYQQAFSNYTANQTNIFNRLASIAGLGQTANQVSAGLAGSLAPSISNTIVGAGTARAAGTVGAANALAGGANNALGWYQLSNFMNPRGGSMVEEMVPGQYSLGNPQYG